MSGLHYLISKTEYNTYNLTISFNDLKLEFDLSDFFKDLSFIDNLFNIINEYIQTLSITTQEEIFNTFLKFYNSKVDGIDFNDITTVTKLEDKITKLTLAFNLNNFKMWLSWRQDELYFPDNIKSEFIFDPDMNVTKEKTYTKKEYLDLISVIMCIRALTPIYIDYYNYIKQVTTHYYYKLYMLFIKSDIYTSEEIEKLKGYIEAIQTTLDTGSNKNEYLIINKGLSDDDIVDSIIGEIIFGKLLTIDFFNKKSNIISFIFQTIKYKSNFAGTDGNIIRSKITKDDSTKEDISYFEDYRKTSAVALGTIVEIQYALDNTDVLLRHLGYTNFDYERYQIELNKSRILLSSRVHKTQIILLGWFLHKFINPRALYYIEVKKLVELLTIAKIVLWDNGHHFISLLMTSYKSDEENFINVLIKYTVNKQIIKKLHTYYSFTIEDDKTPLLEKTITEMSKEITSNIWIPTASQEELAIIKSSNNIISIPNNINDLIFYYIEFINQPRS